MSDSSNHRLVVVEKHGKVALVTLNKPEQLNAIDPRIHAEIERVLDGLAEDDGVNAIVLTGAGRAFSAGGDVLRMRAILEEEKREQMLPVSKAHRLACKILDFEKPIVAAVNGDAVGVGATMALFCDVIYAAEGARFGDRHVAVGLVAGDGSCAIWPLLVGMSRAKEYLLTGDLVPAAEAERIGLINKVLPQDQLVPAAMALAQRLANGATKAINWTKASLNQTIRQQMLLTLNMSLAHELLTKHSTDHREALDAFIEKRRPKFTGK